jgi:hypothetical protein
MKLFQKFEVGYIQICTPLENIQCDTSKEVIVVCFHLQLRLFYFILLKIGIAN